MNGSLSLVYDPTVVADPRSIADTLNMGLGTPPGTVAVATLANAPGGWSAAISLPAAGYVVVRERWNGLDILPGPVAAADVLALGSAFPTNAAQAARLAAVNAILATTPPPLSTLANDVQVLGAYLGLGTPTAAQAEAALSSLIRVVWATAYIAATA